MSTNNYTHKARKRFGQNFLIDQRIIEQIIQAIYPQVGENIVEIGPGCAALTKPLIDACGKITAIELDRDLIPKLEAQFGDSIHLIQADVLKFDFNTLLSGPALRVVGNLPYNISTPLLFHLMDFIGHIHDMHFMLQKEVVERLTASPGNKDYGRLSVMIQYYCQAEAVLDVPPEAFDPAPKVDSMVVRLVPHATLPYPVNNMANLQLVVQHAFNQRRKTLSNTLKKLMPIEQIKRLGIDPSLRPEYLSVADYVNLANSLN
ncbi:MAG: 16S rRNA (adenine(1518)-N(6)/adenine(1519)-N(6))-dimethyltransferase RsmA [Gammaproteobacteria bacterium]|nr:16S rRNA (adenine(1518)-N(6)/adenine(1519)-N(6))-dimethyltransferase RsmA [Gammaproteobacteria bacterium]